MDQRARIIANREIFIRPNLSNGDISIDISDHNLASKLFVSDIVGNIFHSLDNPQQNQRIGLAKAGIYLITVIYNDGHTQTEKILVVE